jgi:hypothetical protein
MRNCRPYCIITRDYLIRVYYVSVIEMLYLLTTEMVFTGQHFLW